MDFKAFRDARVNINNYCYYKTGVKIPYFHKNLVSADIFILANVNTHINKRFYKYNKYLSNLCDSEYVDNLINKSEIYKSLSNLIANMKGSPEEGKLREIENYFPVTFNINNIGEYKFPKWYILRPIDSSGGNDIFYINNKTELEEKEKYYNTTKNYRGIVYGNNVISSEYVENPLLFKNKKFHIRMYMLISVINNKFNCFLFDKGKIFTAQHVFDMKKPFAKDKHDTHLDTTDDDYLYPNDLNKNTITNMKTEANKETLNKFHSKIMSICGIIGRILKNHKNKIKYDNEKNMYDILGLDIMIRDNWEPVFIEINTRPGMSFKKKSSNIEFAKYYFQWINDVVFEPLFKWNDITKAHNHSSYITI